MCTAVLSVEPGQPVLLAGVRDELTDRAWEPPGRHWPQYPGLTGGRDLLAGGTWLAVCDQERRVGCVLNAIGKMAPAATRRSRGGLPLAAAAGQPLDREGLADVDPFHLLTAEPGRAIIQSWDGCELTERTLKPGLHFVVNSGLASDLAGGRPSCRGGHASRARARRTAASTSSPASRTFWPGSGPLPGLTLGPGRRSPLPGGPGFRSSTATASDRKTRGR